MARPFFEQEAHVMVARSDAASCKALDQGWLCSLVPWHQGEHLAFCFHDDTGKPQQIVHRWASVTTKHNGPCPRTCSCWVGKGGTPCQYDAAAKRKP
jgi:hypothetical protein